MADKGFEDLTADGVNALLDPMAEAMAVSMGMPPGGKKYSQQEVDDQWNYSPIANPQVRAETMLQLHQLGVPIEKITDQLYPNRRGLITTSRPKIHDQIQFAKSQDQRMAKLATESQTQMPRMEQPAPASDPVQQPAPEIAPPSTSAPTTQPSILDQPFSMGGM